jgi:hypothetical protein
VPEAELPEVGLLPVVEPLGAVLLLILESLEVVFVSELEAPGAVLVTVFGLALLLVPVVASPLVLLPVFELLGVVLVWAATGRAKGSIARLNEMTPAPIAFDKRESFMLKFLVLF